MQTCSQWFLCSFGVATMDRFKAWFISGVRIASTGCTSNGYPLALQGQIE